MKDLRYSRRYLFLPPLKTYGSFVTDTPGAESVPKFNRILEETGGYYMSTFLIYKLNSVMRSRLHFLMMNKTNVHSASEAHQKLKMH